MKRCPSCEKTKPLTEFYLNKRSHGKDGRSYYCIDCDKAKHKESYQKRREQYQASRRERYNRKVKQLSLYNTTRPEEGPRCACGKPLYPYEIRLGRCLGCQKQRIRSGAYITPQMAGD